VVTHRLPRDSLNPLQSEAVVFTPRNHRRGGRTPPSLNPLQSEAVVFTKGDGRGESCLRAGLNPLQSEAVVFTAYRDGTRETTYVES